MNEIKITIHRWDMTSDVDTLRVVRDAVNYMIKYGYNEKGFNYYHDQKKHVELQIVIK